MLKQLFSLAAGAGLLMLALNASAKEVYVCEQNGSKTFSQTPCGDNAKVENVGDKTVVMALSMPSDDIAYFCRIALRAWDQAGVESSSNSDPYGSYNYRYNRYRSYRSSSNDNPTGRAKSYILSHVSNLEQLAREEPALYRLVLETADRYSTNYGSRDYQYAAERGGNANDCQRSFENLLQETARRRFDADQDHQRQLLEGHGG